MAPNIWDSISLARSQPVPTERKDFTGARDNPCLACSTSPCCWYLPLHNLEPATYLDLDGLYKMLLFEHIEMGLTPDGTWSVYYRFPCRFLDRQNHLCQIHGTELQSKTCVYYKPYGCWYKRVLTGPATDSFLRIDLPRFREIAGLYRFDENRRIVGTPSWDRVQEICRDVLHREQEAGLPQEPGPEVRISDPALENPLQQRPEPQSFLDTLADRCASCSAPCCSYLCFRITPPPSFMSLDFYRFALGFPGVELGVDHETWWLVVHTDCRFFDRQQHRCLAYGQPERPLACSYYNPWSCTYRDEFTRALPPDFARLRYEHLPLLAALMEFDARGQVVRRPGVDELHQALRGYWRELLEQGPSPPGNGSNGKPIVDVLCPAPGSEASNLAAEVI